MIKYFVHAGFQIRTIDVSPTVLGLTGTDNIAVAVMDDVASGFVNQDQFAPILGDSQSLALNTLTGYWRARVGEITKVRQDVLVARAPLIDNQADADDTRNPIPQSGRFQIHKESNRWILPPGLDQIIPIPDSNNPVNGQRLSLIQTMIFDFTNITRFDTSAEAWAAYNNYFLTLGLDDEIVAARQTYFIDPAAQTATTGDA